MKDISVGVVVALCALSAVAAPTLEEGFVNPPNSAKPHTWFHMMNGNITKEGITRDFEELAKAGVGGVQMFDAGCELPAGPLKFNSPDWFDLFRHAQKEAKRLNLEICIPNCSGWSSSGGPWNTPANAMKETVFTETPVKGGSHFSGVLPRTKNDHGFYEDIAVLAYPTPAVGAKISDLAKKTGLARGGNRRDTQEFSREQVVAKNAVVDLTAKMTPDGKLEWEVPDGDWTVLRMGFVCNGRCNHPASEKGRGLEVDKLSASAMDFHFSQYVARLCETLGISSATDNSTGLNNILVDSYEVGCQNWTQGLDATFEKRMGYSLKPYLPVFAGRVVGSVDETERFLEDFRRVLADLFAENYSGRLTKLCHDHGLMCSIETYGGSNADDLQYGQDVDVPMGEFWSCVTSGGQNFSGSGNSRFPAYLAHVWGRRYAAAESFTAGPPTGGKWRTTPYSIKHQCDLAYADGVNRVIYHRFAHQPWADDRYLPGMTMGRWGMHFDRTQTWWHIAPEWLRYQARCQWMLQEGRFAADVLFWCGESAPNSGKAVTAGLEGYDWDVCATKAIEMLKVRNGKIVAPGGVEYEMLVLPSCTKDVHVLHSIIVDNDETTMSERMVRKIGELAAAGAKIVAPVRPVRAPGLVGWPGSDERLRAAVGEVWSKGVMECSAADALKRLAIAPDFTADAPDTSWIHRRGDGADWYFVANGSPAPVSFEASFRQAGRVPEIWDAETGKICDAPVWREEKGRTVVRLDFRPSGSAFVVFRKPSKARHLVAVSTSLDAAAKPERKHELVIEKAEYGVFDGKVKPLDITKRLAAKVRDGSIIMQINEGLSDRGPYNFWGKTARIRYRYDGKTHDVELREGEILQIPKVSPIQPPPAWEWRDGEILAWQPMSAKLSYSDGTVRSVSAEPKPPLTVDGTWRVSFPVDWYTGGANVKTVVWPALKDWTTDDDPDIKYFSGTATYRVSCPKSRVPVGSRVLLDLGEVRNFAEVKVNGRAYPALWRPPYRVDITEALLDGGAKGSSRPAGNTLDIEIKVTNLWPNRLIGDDRLYADDCEWVMRWDGWQKQNEPGIKKIPQWVKDGKPSPTGRHTFTTWKHWLKGDKLFPSGLIGPVKLWFGESAAFRVALADPLAWLYADTKVDAVEGMDEIDVPANGVIDANILLNGLTPGEPLEFHATLSEGEWYRMRAVPVKRNTGATGFLEKKPGDNPHVARRAPFEVFDVLEPLPCKMAAQSQNASSVVTAAMIDSPRETEALRFRLECVPGRVEPHVIRFCVKQGEVTRELSLKVNVHPVALPPVGKDSFKYTNWMDFDSMAASHGLKPWSEEHWKMIEKYVRLAARGRQNVGLMRDVFGKDACGEVCVDKEKFSRFLDLYDSVGIWYLEGTHLARFSNGWGSPTFNTRDTAKVTTTVEGSLALSKLAKMFMEEIEKRGLKDRWYQHVADEPGGKNIGEYRITAGIVRRYMPGIRMVDAVVSPSFAGALDVWCPTVDSFELHRAQYDSFRTNFGDRVWCYTCCVPGGKWMNRTMDGELLRPALIPWVAVMWDIDGFLHWGYNRWQREQGQDPFTEPYPKKWSGSNDGNSLPPGDTHIVYPGTDGPWPSVRLEATRAGMEDADLLTLLRRRDKAQADGVVTRIARGFRDYTPSCKLYREVRRDLLRRIEQEGTGSNSR